MRKLSRAGVTRSPAINRPVGNISALPTLRERVDFLLGIVNKPIRPATNMLFFVMHDIERARCAILSPNILSGMGVPVFNVLSFLPTSTKPYDQIKADLTEVQSLYDNHDSIIVCPISTDQLRAMKIIGLDIAVDADNAFSEYIVLLN